MIEVQNISKLYGGHKALDNINLSISDNEVLGLLGPNGAGKSTLMNIITGYISTTEGSVKIDGVDIFEKPQEAKKKIGYLPEIPPLYIDMTVEEYLYFVSKLKKVPKEKQKASVEGAMESVMISDMRNRLIKYLSKGYRQRVGLAQAIIGDPELLILDEPTVGLDPKQIIEMRDLVKNLGKKHTIILSSHILSEVSEVCSRVVIINKGHLVASGAPEELSKKLSYSNKVLLRVKGSEKDTIDALKGIDNIEKINAQGIKEPGTIDIELQAVKDSDIREATFNALSSAKLPILMMKSMDLSLEQVFLQVTADERKDLSDSNIQ